MSRELRGTGIQVVGDLPWGTHFCQFYDTKDDLLDILVPYFKSGLEGNEACIWIIFEPLSEEEAKDALKLVIPNVEQYFASEQIRIVSHVQWYGRDGEFDLKKVFDLWHEKLAEALAKGYEGVRVNGILTWVTDKDWEAFFEYDKELNNMIVNQNLMVLCAYPSTVGVSEIFDLARTHKLAIAKKNGNWKRLETSEQKRVEAETSKLKEELEARLLERKKELEESLAKLKSELLERQKVEEAKSTGQQLYESLLQSIDGIIWELEVESFQFTFVSNQAERILGYPVADWLNNSTFWIDHLHPDDRDASLSYCLDATAKKKDHQFEYRMIAADGRVVWLRDIVTVHIAPDKSVHLRGVMVDITERKILEEQLRQAQKMEAVGRLAGGIAHDFNNLLTAINGYGELSLMQLDDKDSLRTNLSEIKKAGDRAAALTRQLLAFSRKQILQPKILDLNSVITEIEKMLKRLIGEDLEIQTVLDPKLDRIKADPGQLEHVIMNLAINARDAMPEGGKLRIETRNLFVDQASSQQNHSLSKGHYVVLTIEDDGIGMDTRTQARIFEPFFTTKEVGKGTGLGLSTVYGIVKQSGGNITVQSEVGVGTSFQIFLPRVEDGKVGKIETQDSEAYLRGTETILLAEDDEIVRKMVSQVLKSYGYQVFEAANGNMALLICENTKEPIDLLVSDVVMPEMNGHELAGQLGQMRPEMKVLLMSGYIDGSINHWDVFSDATNFIQKPFLPEALAKKVRLILDKK
jgi:PAS domain S-box-containing protein